MVLRLLVLIGLVLVAFLGADIAIAQSKKECKRLISSRCPKKENRTLKKRAKCYQRIHKKQTKGCRKLNRKLFVAAKKKLRTAKSGGGFFENYKFAIIGFVLLILWLQVCMYGIFSKARYNPWLAFVPFYNSYIFHKIAGVPPLWCVANITPALFYFWPKTCVSLAESFGQDEQMGKTIAVLPFVYLAILGFSPGIQYEGRGKMPKISFDIKL
ncbi:MAG: hypothetical protein HRU09_15995 [Oligoflexales bacterium]|nr:hypothetical protein [Oligoflexales bacterium]